MVKGVHCSNTCSVQGSIACGV